MLSYYLTYKADKAGYSPEIILSGRRLNDSMGVYIAQRVVKLMISKETIVEDSKILILGYTFKENCPDIRNTKVIDIVNELKDYNVEVDVYDPWVQDIKDVSKKDNINLVEKINSQYDAIILAVAHSKFYDIDLNLISKENSIIFDIKSFFKDINNKNIHRL